jgi:hypothetical protein
MINSQNIKNVLFLFFLDFVEMCWDANCDLMGFKLG